MLVSASQLGFGLSMAMRYFATGRASVAGLKGCVH